MIQGMSLYIRGESGVWSVELQCKSLRDLFLFNGKPHRFASALMSIEVVVKGFGLNPEKSVRISTSTPHSTLLTLLYPKYAPHISDQPFTAPIMMPLVKKRWKNG